MVATNRNNEQVFRDGIRKAKIAIEYAIIERLKRVAEKLIVDAELAQEYLNSLPKVVNENVPTISE